MAFDDCACACALRCSSLARARARTIPNDDGYDDDDDDGSLCSIEWHLTMTTSSFKGRKQSRFKLKCTTHLARSEVCGCVFVSQCELLTGIDVESAGNGTVHKTAMRRS